MSSAARMCGSSGVLAPGAAMACCIFWGIEYAIGGTIPGYIDGRKWVGAIDVGGCVVGVWETPTVACGCVETSVVFTPPLTGDVSFESSSTFGG